ncbi:MAG TPA: aminomethyl-transferring glycine dehydrogenase subunit GcvPA [Miltoncostaeaceae bacterium]|nr:aminomethyl-transferring glycine dehydrogenase subunit GcvPA [Miltoncostaeaceae bacterium]
MSTGYLSTTPDDRARMLDAIGAASVDELFADVPDGLRLRAPLALPPALSEPELFDHLAALAGANVGQDGELSFLGFGMYDHYVPAIVDAITSRGEFLTAYTPYQPEISQGTLQAIFEFQTAICELTGLDVSNASMYDGATAAVEAVVMASGQTGRKRVLLPDAVHPEVRAVLATYAPGLELELVALPLRDGRTDPAEVEGALDADVACVVLQHPNALGLLEDAPRIGAACRAAGALLVASVDPTSLGVLAPPGAYGAALAVGEGQAFGNGASYGGPTFGFLACSEDLLRRLPGRLVGETQDVEGRRGYVLAFQTREQHIRREKATSNICTNHALNALAGIVHMSWLGKRGIVELGHLLLQRARYARDRLAQVPGVEAAFDAPHFKEVVMRLPEPGDACQAALAAEGINPGHPLGHHFPGLEDCIQVAVTERRSRADIDRLVAALEARYA